MTGIAERVQAVRRLLSQRRAGGTTDAERAQSKVERAQERAQADERRLDHKRKYRGGGGDGGGGAG